MLKRAGHTEASVDLARLAGLDPAGVLCEIVNDDGTMSRVPDLERFCAEHGLLLISIADLIRHRARTEQLVHRVGEATLPTPWGPFRCIAYRSSLDEVEHLAFVRGDVGGGDPVLVRVHSECLTGDVFGSLRCDCGPQLHSAMAQVAAEGRGRGRVPARPRGPRHRHRPQDPGLQPAGRGLRHRRRQPRARACPSTTASTASAPRSWPSSASTAMRLMTNNPAKYGGLEGFGLEIVERVPIQIEPTPESARYLQAKRDRLGHLLDFPLATLEEGAS